jgi:hypothetical protein
VTDKLQEVLERIEHLPQPLRSEVAARIEEMLNTLDDQAWDEAFADPASDAFFATTEAEIGQARNEGKLISLYPTIEEGE